MATGFASALSEGQPAQLDLGEEAVPCLVVGFTGADVVLAPSGPLPEDFVPSGHLSYLLIDAGGSLQALKANVRPAGADASTGPRRCSATMASTILSSGWTSPPPPVSAPARRRPPRP